MSRRLLGASQAAMLLGTTTMTVTRCAKRGDVPFVLDGRFRLYDVGDLVELKVRRDTRRGRARGRPTIAESTAQLHTLLEDSRT